MGSEAENTGLQMLEVARAVSDDLVRIVLLVAFPVICLYLVHLSG